MSLFLRGRLALCMVLSCWALQASSISQPAVANCNEDVITLSVRPYKWTIENQLTFITRAYFYKDQPMIPGPTIVASPGSTCNIVIENDLSLSSPFARCQTMSNAFQCPDTTNLHTHGLHVSPEEDDPSIAILPGEKHSYTLHIPTDHSPGTFWYHSHYHGASTLQMMGGLLGALLIDPPSDTFLPADVAPLYTPEQYQLLVMSHVNFGGNDTTGDAEFDMADYPGISYRTGQDRSLPPEPEFVPGGERDFYIVNGAYQPIVDVPGNVVHMLRFVQAGVLRVTEVELVDPEQRCELRLIARDGVFQSLPYQSLRAIVMMPGTRSDVAIKCTVPAGTVTDIPMRIFPNPHHDPVLGWGNRYEQPLLLTLRVKAAAEKSVNSDKAETKSEKSSSAPPSLPALLDFPTSQVPLPKYLTSLMNSPLWVGPKNVQGIHMDVDKTGRNMINDVSFPGHHAPESERYLEVLCMGLTYEFLVSPPDQELHFRSAHPYHQHVNHFQVSDLVGLNMTAAVDIIRLGEWRDTVPAFPPRGIKIRTRPALFVGDGMLHCHLQQHSDIGMAALFKLSSEPTCYADARQLSAAPRTGLSVALLSSLLLLLGLSFFL